METRDVVLHSETGRSYPAKQLLCPICGGSVFELFALIVDGETGHNHIQCAECDTSFCQGTGPCRTN
jgi:formate dehydrogenase maturation protein FdhE